MHSNDESFKQNDHPVGRRLREGDIYARSPEFTRFDPSYMLGTEVHHQTVGIVGLGGIGYQGPDSIGKKSS